MEKVLLIMCIWKRVNNLDKILNCLSNQTYKNFKFVIWDNSTEKKEVEKIISKYKLDIEIIKSEKNIGGIGRFHAAKKYKNQFKTVIFFDDDQFPQENFVEIMVKNFEPYTVKSRHCYKILSKVDYWKRRKITSNNTNINYCGTCGMVLDSDIFKHDDLFNFPEEYYFIEDLWLSFYAQHKLHWKLQSIDVPLTLVEDGKDQFRGLINKKSDFLKYLVENQKWDLEKIY
jgi:glycosyltransferase involved in cell wall biosynthesis